MMMNELPYMSLRLVAEQTGFGYDQEQLIKRRDFLRDADLAKDLSERPPVARELSAAEQMALILALGDDELVKYAKVEQIQLPKVIGTFFDGDIELHLDLERLNHGLNSADAFEALVTFAKSNPTLLHYYKYDNQNENADLITTAEAVVLEPGTDLSHVIAKFGEWLMDNYPQ